MKNKVYLVGAGPGKADLITVRGLEILRQAEVVIYDYLVDKSLLNEARVDAQLICCDKLGKKRYSDGFIRHNDLVNKLVIKKFKQGKHVIRLKSGDVSIFSRWSQELEALTKEKIPFELVPGVTAASSASAFSGIPLTDRRFAASCVFATGHEDPLKKETSLDWESLAKSGTIVLYMAVENLGKISQRLIAAGKSKNTAVAIIQDVSLFTQKVLTGTLADIAVKARREKIRPPAIIIIGEVVKLGKQFDWFKKNKKVLFTGISKDRFFGQESVFHLPVIKIIPLKDYRKFDKELKSIADFDWLVFSSRYGVQYFFERLRIIGFDARVFSQAKIAAIGDSTRRRLLDFGMVADLVPKDESAHGLINVFKKIDIKGKRVFIPRSDLSDKGLEGGLRKQGAEVTAPVAYKNIMPQDLPDLNLDLFDEIMFGSPSGVRNFIKRYGRPAKKTKINCIGDVTRREAKKWQLLK